MSLPAVGERLVLTRVVEAVAEEDREAWQTQPDWRPEDDEDRAEWDSEVLVLARDLEEGVWTVWDYSVMALRLIWFDENRNWRWVEPEIDDA